MSKSLVAASIPFDNRSNGFISTSIQKAIEELEDRVDLVKDGYSFTDDFVIAEANADADEFNGWKVLKTGTGASFDVNNTTYIDRNHPGVISIGGSGLNNRISLNRGGPDGSIVLGVGILRFEVLLRPNVVDGILDSYFIQVGLGDAYDSTADHNNGVYFEYNPAVSANWLCKTAAGGTRTTTTTNKAVANGQWARVRGVITGTNKAEFYLKRQASDTFDLVATHTTNIPTGTSQEVSPNLHLVKTIGTSGVLVAVDYWTHSHRGLNR